MERPDPVRSVHHLPGLAFPVPTDIGLDIRCQSGQTPANGENH